jgi:hypothetical protein
MGGAVLELEKRFRLVRLKVEAEQLDGELPQCHVALLAPPGS